MGFWDGILGNSKHTPKRHRKNGVAVGNHWRTLEEKGKRSNHFKGYKIVTQKYSSSTHTRPDFVGYSKKNTRDRIVGDAKNVKELKYQHVDQVRKYKGHPNYAKKGVLIVAKRTKVPNEVREYARDSNITITRMRTKKKPKPKGIFDW